MKLHENGKSTSSIEILTISECGIWMYALGKEYFLPYGEFPWFKNATISSIHHVRLIHGRHLRWEELDIDLDLDSLKYPEHFPLKYQ
jgi:hypothetical protein